MIKNAKRKKVEFKKESPIAEFTVNFSHDSIDCRNIGVEKQPVSATRGYTLLNGISLTNETKTLFVGKYLKDLNIAKNDFFICTALRIPHKQGFPSTDIFLAHSHSLLTCSSRKWASIHRLLLSQQPCLL
jgi:hypothetical protein